MRKHLAAVLFVMMLVAFTGMAFAADAVKVNPDSINPCCGLEKISKVTGTFKSIDRKSAVLVLTGEDGKDTTFKLKSVADSDFKSGDKVEVTCMNKGEECFAKKLNNVDESRGKKL